MRSKDMRKLAQKLRAAAEQVENGTREKSAAVLVAASGLEVLKQKILSEIL
jgi:hypothetical protein